jgi:hypothetical protein
MMLVPPGAVQPPQATLFESIVQIPDHGVDHRKIGAVDE